jgi:Resolvase, N terminal domain
VRVAPYARVSTERQHERGTVTAQLEALRAAAEADGHEVIEEFVDDGYSGARLDRPALDRLRDAAEAGVLDGVICLCADRLARAYAYQAGLLELDDLTRRTAALTARRDQLAQEKDTLTRRSAELATENRLRRRLAGFAERIAASLDDLDVEGRRRLLRLVVERVRVTGWRVEIHLKIPLPDDPPDPDPDAPEPEPDNPPSSDMRLRSVRVEDLGVVDEPVDHRGGGHVVA